MSVQYEKTLFVCVPSLQLVILEELSVFPFPHRCINSCVVSMRQKGKALTFRSVLLSLLVNLQLRNYAESR